MTTHTINLGGVQIGGLDRINGVAFNKLTGWYGVPDVRGGLDPVPGRSGSFTRIDRFRESAVISIEGSIAADSREEVEARISEVTQAWQSATEMTVVDETGAWSRGVEVDHVGFPDNQGWMRHVTFSIDMVAPDPVRYRMLETAGPVGVPSREGGLVLPEAFPWDFGFAVQEYARVENVGSVPVYPVVVVQGSASSITVFGGPRRLGFGAFDGTLRFDSADRRGFLNGVEVTRRMTRRDWPMIPAGVSHDFYFRAVDPSPDLSLFVEYRIGAW